MPALVPLNTNLSSFSGAGEETKVTRDSCVFFPEALSLILAYGWFHTGICSAFPSHLLLYSKVKTYYTQRIFGLGGFGLCGILFETQQAVV